MSSPRLTLFDAIPTSTVTVEIDRHGLSAFASFVVANRHRWSASVWLEDRRVEGFVLRDEETGLELVVRNLDAAAADPLLAWVSAALQDAIGH
jgi:hypothetical protein